MTQTESTAGALLRTWRQRRRLSQLELACEASISQRHLSFVESGRSLPSRDMVLHLAEQLAIPLRERNAILVAAGYAPVYQERGFNGPALTAARQAVDAILKAHEPNPALAIDRHWTLVAANNSVQPLLAGVPEAMLTPPVNVLRLSLHPDGLAPKIVNYQEWRSHILARLVQQIDVSADPTLTLLLDELKAYPAPPKSKPHRPNGQGDWAGIAVPLELMTNQGTLRFISATTVFGTAVDISLSELAIETFLPADQATVDAVRLFAKSGG